MYGVRKTMEHRDLSMIIARPPPPSQVVHARDDWVEANLGNFAEFKHFSA